jgi:hypothetical protein
VEIVRGSAAAPRDSDGPKIRKGVGSAIAQAIYVARIIEDVGRRVFPIHRTREKSSLQNPATEMVENSGYRLSVVVRALPNDPQSIRVNFIISPTFYGMR